MAQTVNYPTAYPTENGFFDGDKWHQNNGVSIRQYFATKAPHEIPEWFGPEMPPKPPYGKWYSEDGLRAYDTLLEAKKYEGDCFYNENTEARSEWEYNYKIQRIAQWPWFWADLVLGSENAKTNQTV